MEDKIQQTFDLANTKNTVVTYFSDIYRYINRKIDGEKKR